MPSKLFNKDIKKSCLWCEHGRKSEYTDEIFCRKRGVTTAGDYCRKYKYDPLKRVPEKQNLFTDYKDDDFKI